MNTKNKTKTQLIRELADLRRRVTRLEALVSDYERREETLHENKIRLHTVLTHAPIMLWAVDDEGIFTFAAGKRLKMLGLKPAEMIGRSAAEIYQNIPQIDADIRRALAGELFTSIVSINGLTFEMHYTPLKNQQGEFIGATGLAADVTERQLMTEILARSEERHRAAAELTSDYAYAFRVEADGTLINEWVTGSFTYITGLTMAEVNARGGWGRLVHPDDAPVLQQRREVLLSGRSQLSKFRIITKSGAVRWIEDHARAVWDEAKNRTVRIYGAALDVTERKEAQQALQKAYGELEKRVEARTTELATANANLRQEIQERQQLQACLSAIHQLGRELTLMHEETTILQRVLKTVTELFRCEFAAYGWVDQTMNELEYRYRIVDGTLERIKLRLPLEEEAKGIGNVVVCRGEALIVSDTQQDSRYIFIPSNLISRSELCAPIRAGQQISGVLNAESSRPYHFTPADQQLLQTLADQTAVALENARLYTETQRHTRELAALNKASRVMASSLDLNTVLERIMSEMKVLLEAEGAWVLLRERGKDELVFAAAASLGSKTIAGLRLPDTAGLVGWAMAKKQSVLVDNAQQDPRFYKGIDLMTGIITRSLLVVPLIVKDKVIGVIETINKINGHFDQHDLEILEALASSAVIAIENARLHAETQRRLDAQIALRHAGAAIFSTLDLDDVLNQIAEQIGRPLDATSAYIGSYEAQSLRSTLLAEYISPEASPQERTSYLGVTYDLGQISPTIVERFKTGQTWVAYPDAPDMNRFENPQKRWSGAQAILVIPLKMRKQLIAYAEIWESRYRRDFSDDEIALGQDIAQQAVIAIENARLHAETERRAKQLSVLHELDQAITACVHIDDVYDAFARHTIRLIAYDCLSIVLVEREQFHVAYTFDHDQALISALDKPSFGQDSVVGRVIATGKPLLRHNIAAEARFSEDETLLAKGIHAMVLLPLRVKGTVIGVWNMGCRQVNAYTLDDLQIAQSMADQLAIAIENARLFEAEQVQRRRIEALQAAGAAVSSTLDLSQVLDRLLTELGKVIAYDSASVFLVEEEHVRMTTARSLPDSTAVGQRFQPDELTKTIEHSQQPLIIADAQQDRRFQADANHKHTRAWMSIPLLVRNQFIGYFTLTNHQPAAYSQTEANLALSFANQAAIAVENARLYQHLQNQMQVLQEAQAQLIRSEKLAALGQLSAAVAHEINNPLQAIKNVLLLFREELESSQSNEKFSDYLGATEQEIDRISKITHQMRNFYRPLGRELPMASPLNLETIDGFYRSSAQEWQLIELPPILEDILQLVDEQLQQNTITVKRRWAKNLSAVQGNVNHLKQVFLNLILNAIEGIETQGGMLYLKAALDHISYSDGSSLPAVRLEFSDTGAGIPSEIMSRLFDPFFSTKKQGSGLGLFISHKIIEAHNGQINVESQVGLGTTFSILLPLEQPGNTMVRNNYDHKS